MHIGHLQASCEGQQSGRGGDIMASMLTTILSKLLCHGSASAGATSMMAASCESPRYEDCETATVQGCRLCPKLCLLDVAPYQVYVSSC